MTNLITDLIDQCLTEANASDPRAISTVVLSRLEDDDLLTALEIVLPAYVQTYLSTRRRIPSERPLPTEDKALEKFDTTMVEFEYDLADDERAPQIKSVSSGRSTRVAAVRSDWQRQLETTLCVGNSWKQLGKCTSDDLLLVAADLRRAADSNLTKAAYYENLAALVPEGSVLGDLTENPLVNV